MTTNAPLPALNAVVVQQLTAHLEAEMTVQKQLLALAERKQREIVSGDMVAFNALVEREQSVLTEINRLRQLRDRLVHALAGVLNVRDRDLRLSRVLELSSSPTREALARVRDELTVVMLRLRTVNDRNTLLIRQSLGLLRDVMQSLVGDGSVAADPYDRRGNGGANVADRGALVNIRG